MSQFCPQCGKEIGGNISFCPYCGGQINVQTRPATGSGQGGESVPGTEKSPKNWITTLLLEAFLGFFGIHRFYVGRIGTGILWLVTFGIFGIGWVVDLTMIILGRFKDKQGRVVTINFLFEQILHPAYEDVVDDDDDL